MVEGIPCGCHVEMLGGAMMRIEPGSGGIFDTLIRHKNEAHLDFKAEMDCLIALTACPESGRGGPVRVQVFEE